MLPLGLFRRRAFTGVQLAAFAVSGSMFALFLYLTLYLQSFLGLSPIEAGLRYLPITVASFIVAPLSGMALAKVQARYLMAAGLALTGARAAADVRPAAGLGVDRAAARLPRQRHRRRAAEPGDRRRRAQRRAERAERDGGRDQRHLPPGRDRGRDRRLGRDLPRRRGLEDAGGGRRLARRRPGAEPGRGDLLGRAAAGGLGAAGRGAGRWRGTPPNRGSSTA